MIQGVHPAFHVLDLTPLAQAARNIRVGQLDTITPDTDQAANWRTDRRDCPNETRPHGKALVRLPYPWSRRFHIQCSQSRRTLCHEKHS